MKNNIFWILFVLICSLILSFPMASVADDLDDKIGTYTDGSIQSDDAMGDGSLNIKYLKMNAKSNAKVRQKADEKNGNKSKVKTGKTDASGNMNSVVMGAGTNIKGDIIIIDESKGPKTQIVDK
mgnify:CR=1 FL=1